MDIEGGYTAVTGRAAHAVGGRGEQRPIVGLEAAPQIGEVLKGAPA